MACRFLIWYPGCGAICSWWCGRTTFPLMDAEEGDGMSCFLIVGGREGDEVGRGRCFGERMMPLLTIGPYREHHLTADGTRVSNLYYMLGVATRVCVFMEAARSRPYEVNHTQLYGLMSVGYELPIGNDCISSLLSGTCTLEQAVLSTFKPSDPADTSRSQARSSIARLKTNARHREKTCRLHQNSHGSIVLDNQWR